MKTTELNKKIAKLKAEDSHKTSVKKKLGKIEHSAYLSEWKDKTTFIVNADCKDLAEAKKVLLLFPPTNKNTVIGTATDKYFKNMPTPFDVKIENPPVCNSSQKYSVHIGYESGKHEVKIELPIEFITEFVKREERYITDCEYHYFIGYSHEKLRNTKVMCYKFKDVLNDEQINWFGGDQSLCKISIIDAIINKIKA